MQHLSSPKHPWPAAGLLLLLLLLLAGPAVRAQAPAWQSAVALLNSAGPPTGPGAPNPNVLYVSSTAADASGNVYLAGNFRGIAQFTGVTTLTSRGASDVFVAKWNLAAARFVWVQQAGGTGSDEATAVAVSGTSVYVAGFFGDAPATFGPIALANAGGKDGFVAKLTDAGATSSFAWAQSIGGANADQAEGIAVSGSNVYLVGSFGGTAIIGPYSLRSVGNVDVFVARLTDQGTTADVAWALRAGGVNGDRAVAVTVNGSNVYVAGEYTSLSADFGSSTISNMNNYNGDIFVTKLTDTGSTGSFVWAQSAGGNDREYLRAIAVSGSNVYIAGSFGGAAAFGPLTVTAVGAADNLFVAKLTDAGTTGSFGWVQRGGAANYPALALALAVQGTNVYVTGGFTGAAADFGPTILTSANLYDIVVAKLTDAGSTGSFVWAQRAGGGGNDAAISIMLMGSSIYVAGYVTAAPTASFGSLTLTGPNGYLISYLAALTDPTLTATTAARGSFSFTLAPNPARASTTVQLPNLPSPATLTLLDAMGRAVRTRPATPGTRTEFDLSGLAPGPYALRATAGAASATQRLVVE